ncbi:hypothetical protein Ahy_A06g029247 isoform B [Arachis hypogaea]|uniref:Uncharacterized protein n=1 Tax=Arachis hypogaea TaxID=3818 RepID=A0A445CSP0_ARAHY|nr:hypothetical protein Ahy_A06g029247 isoform A [Arachis hypogaea]RYR53989.1 hypothetical protein Ahy_A06g029247 isoform B [Arachis hypogaea]
MKTMVTPLMKISPFSRPNGIYINKPSSLVPLSPLTPQRNSSSPNSLTFPTLTPTLSVSMAASPQSTAPTASPGGVNINKDDVFQLIQAHQEKAARLPPVEEIRTFLDRSVRGMLSTYSKKFEGYPSGSMVDFACDANGYPILAVSDLAVHTKDLAANPKCSLLVPRDPEDRTDLVVTLHGDAVSVPENDKEAVRAAYLARHPNAFWVDFGDFHFLRIEPKVVRYVSGVATALLGSGGLLTMPFLLVYFPVNAILKLTREIDGGGGGLGKKKRGEFSPDEYKAAKVDPLAQFSKPVASHMNKDHAEDTTVIVQHWTSVPVCNLEHSTVESAYMLDVDSVGFNVKAGYKGDTFKLRVPFPRRAADRKDIKTLIVEMLQAARPHVD